MQVVYHRRKKISKGMVSVPQDTLNAQIEVVDNLYGKYYKANLIDNDFTDCFHFPAMKKEVYAEEFQKDDSTRTFRVREEFKGIQGSTLLHFRSLPVFDTHFSVM